MLASDGKDAAARGVRALAINGERGRWALLSLGKASRAMMAGVRAEMETEPVRWLCVAPQGDGDVDARGRVLIGEHPLPGEASVHAGDEVMSFVRSCAQDWRVERLVVCLSGGASAMVCMKPRGGLEVGDIREVQRALMLSGATIGELNSVRRELEEGKGGGLARMCSSLGAVDVLVLSDVLGDDLPTIASGPFSPNPTSAIGAMRVIEGRGLTLRLPTVVRVLRERATVQGMHATPQTFANVRHVVVGNNEMGVNAAVSVLREAGCEVEVGVGVQGEARELGQRFAERLLAAAARGQGRPGAVVWGGETTVSVRDAGGFGGRNQEAALAAALVLEGAGNVACEFFSTDGVDGVRPSPDRQVFAGARVDGSVCERARRAGVDLRAALERNDSYHAVESMGIGIPGSDMLGTNVNDVWIGLYGASAGA